jgi:hypothetical protein
MIFANPLVGARIPLLAVVLSLGFGLGDAQAGAIVPYNIFSGGFDQAVTDGGLVTVYQRSAQTTYNVVGVLHDSYSSTVNYKDAASAVVYAIGGSSLYPLVVNSNAASQGDTLAVPGSTIFEDGSGNCYGFFTLSGAVRATLSLSVGVSSNDPGPGGANSVTAQASLLNVTSSTIVGSAFEQIVNGAGNQSDITSTPLTLPAGEYYFFISVDAQGSSISSGATESNSQSASAGLAITNLQPVPEPSGFLLLTTAVLALAAAFPRLKC